MASYTIEDIELIRKKSGISYQEAVALLDYHNGNVARALIDLERNGRLHPENARPTQSAEHTGERRNKGGFSSLMTRLYQFRLKVRKGDVVILNLSVLFSLLALLVSPHLVIIGLVLMLILGYRITFDRKDGDFASDNLESMVKNAAQNVKESVSGIAREFAGDSHDQQSASSAAPDKQDAPAPEKQDRSYYQSNPAATTYHAQYGGSAPVLQVPVQVESQDGSVKVDSDEDGYNNATIE